MPIISESLLKDLRRRHKAGEFAKPAEFRDTQIKGFLVRVQPSGYMAFYLLIDRTHRVRIGNASILTPTQARNLAIQTLAAAAEGKDPLVVLNRRPDPAATGAPTLAEFVAGDYGAWVKVNRKTGAESIGRIKACFFAEFGNIQIDQITPLQIDRWRLAKLQRGRKMATLNKDIAGLRAAMSRAVAWGLIDRDPLVSIKPGKGDTTGIVRYLSSDEERRLRAALVERDAEARAARDRGNDWRAARQREPMPALGEYPDRLTPLVLLSLNTGCRRGELFGLRWSEVDLDRAVLTVKGSGAKSGRTRHIPLNAEAVAVMKSWRPAEVHQDALVFPGQTGERLFTIKRSWATVLTAAGIERFRWHDLRHTFASKLVMRGVDLNTVRDLLGHASLDMTLRYAHLAPEHKAAAVAKLVGGDSDA